MNNYNEDLNMRKFYEFFSIWPTLSAKLGRSHYLELLHIQNKDERNFYMNEYGKGFPKRNLELMRKFYVYFSITTSLMSQLTWSHYKDLIKIKNQQKRDYYINEFINSNLIVKTLNRKTPITLASIYKD